MTEQQPIYNLGFGKLSCNPSNLPAPNQRFKLTKDKLKSLKSNASWKWESYLYMLSKGKKVVHTISYQDKRALKNIGLIVRDIDDV